MTKLRWTLAAVLPLTMCGWLACSGTDDNTGNDDDDSSNTTSASGGNGGAGGMSTSSGIGGIDFTGVGGSGAGGPGIGCSADLRYVVDGNGVVLEECWPDAGCSNGMCVAPCTAAGDSQGNVGCEFTVATPHFYVGIKPPCFAVFVANNWPKDAPLTIERDGVSYDVTQFGRIASNNPDVNTWAPVPATGVPPDQVAVLFLSHDPASVNGGPLTCPITPAISVTDGTAVPKNTPTTANGVGVAWKITSGIPVSMYDMLPYGGALSFLPSAALLMPTTAWGDNYIAVLPKPSAGPPGPPWGQIVASQDNTIVQILPSIALPAAGTVPPGPANTTTQFVLNAGEYVQWQFAPGQDMSGSVIQSDKPIAFTGGNGYICYSSATSSGGGCDSAHQQIPPISAQGSEYVAPPYADRGNFPESIFYRLVGSVDGTQLSYDPPVAGAPATINAGQVVDFETVGAFAVSSQDDDHPFYVGQIMSGCILSPGGGTLGDEEYVNILPPAQYLKKYVFFSDPTYPTTNLVVTRVKGSNGYSDVNIGCLGTVTGWQPIGNGDRYEITNVDLIRNGTPNMGCSNGPQTAQSEGQFGLMVWGLDTYSSYAYPAGGNATPINTVVVPPTPN